MEATFDNKTNLLAANVRSFVDSSVLYNISTTHNLWGRTVTVLKDANPALGNNSPIVGAIYWRERLFEVNGHRKSISDIKSKPPGFVAGVPPQPKSKSKKSRSRSKARDEPKKKKDRSRSRDARKADNNRKEEKKSRPKQKAEKKKKNAPELEAKHSGGAAVAVVPSCTSSLSFYRRSSLLFSQIGLGDWWRAITCKTRYWRWSADRTEYELVYHHEQWKALINLDDDENNEKGSGAVTKTNPAHPPAHMRTRSASDIFGARDSVTIRPGHNSGFSATTTTINNLKQSRHSSFSFGTATLFSASPSLSGSDRDERRPDSSEDEEEKKADPEKLREDRRTSASLYIPYRNHLFHKTKPAVLRMKADALLQDEVFLLLVLIYSETKRQDSTNSSGEW